MSTELPIVEQIALELFDRLKQISPANGYNTAVSSVVRPARMLTVEDFMLAMRQADPERDEELSVDGNPDRVAWVQPFVLSLFLIPSQHDDEPLDTKLNRFSSDVVKAVTTSQDASDWAQFSGLAVQSEWAPPSRFQSEDGSIEGLDLTLNVSYRTPQNDPYSQG